MSVVELLMKFIQAKFKWSIEKPATLAHLKSEISFGIQIYLLYNFLSTMS